MMKLPVFVGRKNELERLETLKKKQTASLVVVKGRRRIGKSRLITQFVSKYKKISYGILQVSLLKMA